VLGSLAHDPGSPDSVLSEEVRRWIDQDFEASRGVHEVVDPSRPRFVGGQFSVRRAVFERIGGFDSAFNRGRGFGNADFDLDLRLREAGARVVFNGDAVSTQTYVHEFRGVWRIFELMGRSDVAFDRKHPNRGRPQTRSLPPPATRKGRIARETLRHPYLTSALARPLAGVAGPLVDGGSRSRLTRGLGYVTLTHRYWYGVAMEGGGSRAGVRGPKPALAVLCYHRLTPPPLPRQLPWTTAPAELVRQVRAAVDDGWQLITPDEAAEFLRGGGAIPLRSMLITFDDGYADLADRGVAVLEDLGARALAFLVTGKLGARADWGDDPGPVPSPLLDVEQVLELAGRGTFEFGAHGRTHVAMPGLAAERLGAEVLEARMDLEAVGLPTPRFLAYPYGEFDAAARRAAAPYLGAFTTRDGLVRPDADWTRLPRVEVLAGTTPSQLVRRLRRLVFEAGARYAGGRARWAAGRALRRLAR
jgi:peptidoglycan/xylan/chitin deacetylase (PgdA/CDA1 family)